MSGQNDELPLRWEGEVPALDAPALMARVVGVLAAQGYAIEEREPTRVRGTRSRVPDERFRRWGRMLLVVAGALLALNLYLLTSTDASYEASSVPIVVAVLVGGWGLSWTFRTARTAPRTVEVRVEGSAPALRVQVRGDETVGTEAFAALARQAQRAGAPGGGA
jgi:hypothetical protein